MAVEGWLTPCEVSISFSLAFLTCSYSSKSDIFSVIRDSFWHSIFQIDFYLFLLLVLDPPYTGRGVAWVT